MTDPNSPILCLSAGPAEANAAARMALPHVLLVLDGFPKTLGGGERIVLRLAELLPHYGYRVSILTLSLHPESEFQPAAAPCPLYLLPLQKTYDLAAWKGAFALRRFLKGQEVRIVQTFFESSDLWAGGFTRLFSDARLIWSRRDMGILRGRKHTLAYRALRRLPHAVFAVSEQVREHAIRVDRITATRVHTVHNGLELQQRTEPCSQPFAEHATVTTIGNIRRVKGHDLLIHAAAEVVKRFPDTNFTIAGEVLEPEYFALLQSMVRELGLSHRFRFLGRITDLHAHLDKAHIFVLPSRSEGFSNALIEAMAAGLPTIATNVGGNAEAVQEGVSGILVPPENAPAIAAAILQLLSNPEIAQRMGTAGQQAVHAHFTAEAMIRNVTGVYALILQEQ